MRNVGLVLVVVCALVGCRKHKKAGTEVAADAPRVLAIDGQEPMAVEGFDVDLNDDENAPEVFRLHGQGFTLAGTLPPELHVGYGEKFEVLVGQTASIVPSAGEYASELGISHVSSGTLSIDGVTRKDGIAVSGQVTLRLSDGRVVHGSFVARAKTWG
jgi:hypothetical protein